MFWLEKLKIRDHLEDVGVDGKIILEWILGNGVKVWSVCIWLRVGVEADRCEHGKEPWVS
jgi:hypothetical protein